MLPSPETIVKQKLELATTLDRTAAEGALAVAEAWAIQATNPTLAFDSPLRRDVRGAWVFVRGRLLAQDPAQRLVSVQHFAKGMERVDPTTIMTPALTVLDQPIILHLSDVGSRPFRSRTRSVAAAFVQLEDLGPADQEALALKIVAANNQPSSGYEPVVFAIASLLDQQASHCI